MKLIFWTILVMAVLLALTSCGTTLNGNAASTNESGALPPEQQQESNAVPDVSDTAEDTGPSRRSLKSPSL